MKGIATNKMRQHECAALTRPDAGTGGHASLRYRVACCCLALVAICMMTMLSACMNSNNGDKPVLKSTASGVFKDKGSAVIWLAEAAAKGDRQAVRDLVRQGADVNAQGESNFSVLQWALLNKNIDGMLALLEAGADPALTDEWGGTVMHYAAGMEDPKPLQALLNAGISPDLRDSLNGQTPIFEAIMLDREPQFQALLAAGADMNAQAMVGEGLMKTGDRPLHHAASVNTRFILPLLEAGADPRALDGRGRTFQPMLNMLKESIATDEFIQNKRKIEAWLVEHGVELEREYVGTADNQAADTPSQQ